MHTHPSLSNLADDSAAACTAGTEQAPVRPGVEQAPVRPAAALQSGHHAPAAGTRQAQLLIHATDAATAGGGTWPTLLNRTRAWAQVARMPWAPTPSGLRVADIHGRQFFCADALPALTCVPLPAGTYHVSFSLGGQQRRYTVALEPGATFNLHLRAQASRL